MSIGGKLSRFKNYSYTNARVRAMRANLISDNEYRKLMKMELAEIAEFLSNRGYSTEMEELGSEYEGEELVERALKRNLSNTYMKLLRISPEGVQNLLHAYYRKFEVNNLKAVLRHKHRGSDEDIIETLIPTSNMDREVLYEYLELDSVDDVLREFTITGFDGELQQLLEDAETLQEMEDVLDKYYYENLQETAGEASVDSRLFDRFLQLEAALTNITLILRMKRQEYSEAEIRERLINIPKQRQIVDTDELLRASDYTEALETVRESEIGEYVETDSPAELHRALEKYKLETGIEMLHRDQLSVNPILGFMICKEIEFSNLRMIVRAKEENLGEEFIERNLVRGVSS